MSAVKQAGGAGEAALAAAVAAEVKKYTDPLQGLLEQLAKPASSAGLTPAELLSRMTDGGRNSGLIGGDGAWTPASALHQRRAKGLGWGELYAGLAELHGGHVSAERTETLKKKLFGDPNQGGYGLRTKAALAESSGVTGGYTVPPQFSQQLLKLAMEDSIVDGRATAMPMTGLTLSVPYLDQTTAQSAGRSAFLGGVVASWTAEAATRDESEPTFRQCELKAWELSFYTVASNNLLADNAVGLDSLLTQLFSMAIAWYTEYAYLQGDGVGKPQGLIGAPSTIAVSRGTASRVRYVDVVTMLSRLLMQSWEQAVWVAHQSTLPDLLQMHDSSGNQTGFGAGRLIFQSIDQGATKGPAGTLLGRPIYFTEKVPSLGNKGDISIFDFSKYLLGRRMEVEIAVSPHVKFLNNSMVWRVVWRGDGRPWLSGPITLADGTYTVSPHVTLAA